MAETVIDSRVAQLEAALAEIAQENTRLTHEIFEAREACPSGRMQDYFDAPLLTLVNKEVSRGFNRDAEVARQAAVANDLRAQVATLHQEQARKQATIDELIADWSDTQNQWRDLEARLTRKRDEARADYDKLLTSWAEACEKRVEAQRQTDTLTRQLAEAQQQHNTSVITEQRLRSLAEERAETAERQIAAALRLAKEATNGWACYASRKVEHDEIARLHKEIALLPASPPETARAEETEEERRARFNARIRETGLLDVPASPTPSNSGYEPPSVSELEGIIDRKEKHIERLQRQIAKLETRIESLMTVDDGNPWKPEPAAPPRKR